MGESERAREPGQVERGKRSGKLPPGNLDVIYTSGFPPVWQIWKRKGMVTIQPSRAQRGAADGIEQCSERRGSGAEHSERSARSGKLPPGKLDVIYIGGFPPVWQIWKRKGMVTIQPSRAQRGAADGVEWERERREAETMAELANRDEQSAKSEQAEQFYRRTGELPPGKLDVIYIGGIPPLRQLWRDVKAIIKERRESPPPLE